MSKVWEKFYECECHEEGIMVSYEKEDHSFYLAIFRNSYDTIFAKSLKGRLKQIWQIIRYGTLWKDNIILNKKEAKKLAQDILKKVEEN